MKTDLDNDSVYGKVTEILTLGGETPLMYGVEYKVNGIGFSHSPMRRGPTSSLGAAAVPIRTNKRETRAKRKRYRIKSSDIVVAYPAPRAAPEPIPEAGDGDDAPAPFVGTGKRMSEKKANEKVSNAFEELYTADAEVMKKRTYDSLEEIEKLVKSFWINTGNYTGIISMLIRRTLENGHVEKTMAWGMRMVEEGFKSGKYQAKHIKKAFEDATHRLADLCMDSSPKCDQYWGRVIAPYYAAGIMTWPVIIDWMSDPNFEDGNIWNKSGHTDCQWGQRCSCFRWVYKFVMDGGHDFKEVFAKNPIEDMVKFMETSHAILKKRGYNDDLPRKLEEFKEKYDMDF